MHILYIHQYFALPEYGGATRSYEMGRRLVSYGHNVTMVTSSAFLPVEYSHHRGWRSFDIEGMTVHVLSLPYSNKLTFFKRMQRFVAFLIAASTKARKIRADVVFATSTPLTVYVPARIASRKYNVPLVFEVRDLWPDLPIAVGALTNRLLMKAAKWLEQQAYTKATAIIALSPGMARVMEDKGVCRTKIRVIPNGCDNALFDEGVAEESSLLERFECLRSGKLIVYTGTLGHINGVSYLVELAKAANMRRGDMKFVIVGDGVELPKVKRLAQEYGLLDQNVFFLPYLSKSDIAALLHRADIACSLFIDLPEMWNNSANKFFDALAAACPVMINYGGWQADVLERSGAGVVVPATDIACAFDKLNAFLSDQDDLRAAGKAAKRLALEEYDRDKLAGTLNEVLVGVGRRRAAKALN